MHGVSARRGTAALASKPEVASTPGTHTTTSPSLRRSHGGRRGCITMHLTTSRLTPVMKDLTQKDMYALDTSDRHPRSLLLAQGAVR